MAIINTLRNKLGKFVVFAIAFSIAAFILADLLGPNSVLLGGQSTTVGEIAGEEIDLQQYNNQVEILKTRYGNPGESQMQFVRNAAWEALISNIAFGQEFETLGLSVSDDELVDMVQGRNIDPGLRQQFTNPATGEYDVNQVIQILQQYSGATNDQQAQWINFEKDLKQGRLRIKYDNLLGLTNYVTDVEAKAYYNEQSDIAEIKYLYVPFYSVSDSVAAVDDAKLNAYLNEHEEDYKIEESKTVNFVNFEVLPSGSDSARFHEEMQTLKTEFGSRSDDSVYARITSDLGSQYFTKYAKGELPSLLQINANTLQEKEVYGPYYEGGKYKLYKISEIIEDTVYQAKARHILFKPVDDTEEARKVLSEIKGGADFAAMAAEHGTDNTATRGGELGWGTQGSTWVSEFEKPVFEKTSAGLVNDVVESDFGYHIIEVQEPKTNQAFKIASIELEITPSQETTEEVYRQADLFAFNSGNADEFKTNAEKEGLEIQTGADIDKMARNVGNVSDAREVVRWIFNDASIGQVSSVFDLNTSYMVVLLVSEKEEGTANLEDVRNEITIKVRNNIKAGIIKEKLAAISGTLDEMATSYGTDASVHTSSDLKLNSNSLPAVGFAPAVVGAAFALEPGARSEPIETDNGIVVIESINKTGAPEIADYAAYKNQMQQNGRSRISANAMEAIKQFADIEDNRYKFY